MNCRIVLAYYKTVVISLVAYASGCFHYGPEINYFPATILGKSIKLWISEIQIQEGCEFKGTSVAARNVFSGFLSSRFSRDLQLS